MKMRLGRSKQKMTYHNRTGCPVLHTTEAGRQFIMVRAPCGRGTKRLYLKHGKIPVKYKHKPKHRK